MHTSTIEAAVLDPRKASDAIQAKQTRADREPTGPAYSRRVNINSADSYVRRCSANLLLKQRYGWRGYQSVSLPADQTTNRITLTADEDGDMIGTITVGLDGPEGMNCDDVFPAEVAALRAQGQRLCEFTKLAVDPASGTKRVLAALFHVAYIVAHRLRGFDTLVMEVNPRHVRYYERMLGARVIGEERLNRSVNAPAVLLSISFRYIMAQIDEMGGQPERAATERSLYPFAYTKSEEQELIARMMSSQKPASLALN